MASMLHLLRDTKNGCALACARARTLPTLDHAPIASRHRQGALTPTRSPDCTELLSR